MRKTIFLLTTIAVFAFACKTTKTATQAKTSPNMATLTWNVLKAGSMGSAEAAKNVLIKSAVEWQKEWAETNRRFEPAPPAPAVDFEKNWVIGCHIGTRSNGGYGANIKEVKSVNGEINVVIEEKAPGKGCMNSEVITHPFVYITVPHFTESKVNYQLEKVVKDCN